MITLLKLRIAPPLNVPPESDSCELERRLATVTVPPPWALAARSIAPVKFELRTVKELPMLIFTPAAMVRAVAVIPSMTIDTARRGWLAAALLMVRPPLYLHPPSVRVYGPGSVGLSERVCAVE